MENSAQPSYLPPPTPSELLPAVCSSPSCQSPLGTEDKWIQKHIHEVSARRTELRGLSAVLCNQDFIHRGTGIRTVGTHREA